MKAIKEKCIICKFDIVTTNYKSHGINLCWKHNTECMHYFKDRMFNDKDNVIDELEDHFSRKRSYNNGKD